MLEAGKKFMRLWDVAREDAQDDDFIPVGEVTDFPEAFVFLEKVSQSAENLHQPAFKPMNLLGFNGLAVVVEEWNVNFEFLHFRIISGGWENAMRRKQSLRFPALRFAELC
jgi:hypothetical protein